jgi:hypothetical protein
MKPLSWKILFIGRFVTSIVGAGIGALFGSEIVYYTIKPEGLVENDLRYGLAGIGAFIGLIARYNFLSVFSEIIGYFVEPPLNPEIAEEIFRRKIIPAASVLLSLLTPICLWILLHVLMKSEFTKGFAVFCFVVSSAGFLSYIKARHEAITQRDHTDE